MTLRVLHCPTNVGGHAGGLARAERRIGLASWAVSLEPVQPGHEIDEVLWNRRTGRLLRERRRWQLVRRAEMFDVVHFNFGSPILPRRYPRGLGESRLSAVMRGYATLVEFKDVRRLHDAGKAIIVTYQGDDARQADWCREHYEVSIAHEVAANPASDALDERRRKWISTFDHFAGRIYALNPDTLHVLPRRAEFLPYAHIDLDEWRPPPPAIPRRRPVRLLHAPSNPTVKGTRFLLAAVERLRAEGVDVELELVTGLVPRGHARKAYERCDLAVDQLLAGWYGGIAVELMALGKPVICFIRDDDMRFVPEAMRSALPLIRASPLTIYDVLREWLTGRREELAEVGARSRAFVESWHDRYAIARRLRAAYEELAGTS